MKVRALFISDCHIGSDYCNHEKLLKLLYANQDLYFKKKPSIWSFKENKYGVSIKEIFRKRL